MKTNNLQGEDYFPQGNFTPHTSLLEILQSVKLPSWLKQWNWRHWTIFYTAIGLFVILLFMLILIGINAFFDKNYLQFNFPIQVHFVAPIEIKHRKPVVVEKKIYITPTPTPKPFSLVPQAYAATETDYQVITSKKNGYWLWKIYRKESSAGKNDSCKEKGLFNGFGFHQDSDMWMCYGSLEEVASNVEQFFIDALNEGMSLPQATCYYNTGNKHLTSCNYYYEVASL